MREGPQQSQGEVLEIELESLLKRTFPIDVISEVGKGVSGGDVIQSILDSRGAKCGMILWESKRTKRWSDGWITKVKDDMRESRAQCAVIVSEALPDDVRHFCLMDGVWVCSWPCVAALATALRHGLVEFFVHSTVNEPLRTTRITTYLCPSDLGNSGEFGPLLGISYARGNYAAN